MLNSLPLIEYEGAILVIKEKLSKEKVDLPEIEKILDDRYQSMNNVKGWDDKEDDYALFTNHTSKKKYKKQFKGRCAYCGEYGHKAVDCPNKKAIRIKVSNGYKKMNSTKRKYKGNGHKDMPKIKCYNCGEYGHYAHDCPKHVTMPILLEKMSKTKDSQICWI